MKGICFLLFHLAIFCSNPLKAQPHEAESTHIVEAKPGEIGLADLRDGDHIYYSAMANHAPWIYWQLATALSLRVPLLTMAPNGEWNLYAESRQGKDPVIDCRYIFPQRLHGSSRIEYFFEKGTTRIKLFDLSTTKSSELVRLLADAAGAQGFLKIKIDAVPQAQWHLNQPFDPNAWTLINEEPIHLEFISFSNLVSVLSDKDIQHITFQRTKHFTADKSLRTYIHPNSGLKLSGQQKEYIRALELEVAKSGGSIYCAHEFFEAGSCVRLGRGFSFERQLSYTQKDVRRLVRLSIGHLPTEAGEPLTLDDGSIIASPLAIWQIENEDYFRSVLKPLIESRHSDTVVLPVVFRDSWVAFSINLQDNAIIYLSTLVDINVDLFDRVRKSASQFFPRHTFENSCVKIYHISNDAQLTTNAPLIIESILRELKVGGPAMPFSLCSKDMSDLQSSHEELVRFFQNRPNMISPH